MTSAPASARGATVGLRSERGPVLGSIMLSTALIALDSTIIATAVPSIVRDLGGFSQFPWLFSLYLLTQAVTVPIYGKLADIVGRKPLLIFGVGVFVTASLFCGLAWSMPVLIAGRALQGVGAGAVQPIGMTVIGDLYTVQERARVQGYLASVWGASSVIGPLLGGLFSEYLSWRWIFFVNLPLGALAILGLHRGFAETVAPRRHVLDVGGAVLLTSGCSLLIFDCSKGAVPGRGARRPPTSCSARRPRSWPASSPSSGERRSRCCRCGWSAAESWSAATLRRWAWGFC